MPASRKVISPPVVPSWLAVAAGNDLKIESGEARYASEYVSARRTRLSFEFQTRVGFCQR